MDWKGLKIPVQMPHSMHSQANFSSSPSAGLTLDLKNPLKTRWENSQIELDGQRVPIKINAGVFTYRTNPNQGIFLEARKGPALPNDSDDNDGKCS